MQVKIQQNRYHELDALRGIAVLAMVTHHFLFQLWYFNGVQVVNPQILSYAASVIASLFLLIIGICFQLSWSKNPEFNKAVKRFVLIGSLALCISVVTYIADRETYIYFGILHLIALSALLLPLFYTFKKSNSIISIALLLIPHVISVASENIAWHILGLSRSVQPTLDYYPILPWLGVILIGMAIAEYTYIPKRHQIMQNLDSIQFPSSLLWTGKHALLLYFLHIPIISLLVFLIR